MEKFKILECSVRIKRCDSGVETRREKSQIEPSRSRAKRETDERHDGTAAALDWIKRESDVYETDELYIEEELEIGPTVVQPRHPVKPKVKLERTSGKKKRKKSVPLTRHKRGKQLGCVKTRPFVCSVCNKNFTKKDHLTTHMFIHTNEKPFKCSFCHAKFTQHGNLKRHIRTHTGEKPYRCTICGLKFAENATLKNHMRCLHTGERPFKCRICDKRFKSNNMRVHMRQHTGEQPFECKTCDAKFTSRNSLKTHVYKHTGERPFSCTICDVKFYHSISLAVHIRTHTGEQPYSCSVCHEKFTHLSSLRDHEHIHTGKLPFGCTICDRKFIRAHSLKIHMRRIHNEEDNSKVKFVEPSHPTRQLRQPTGTPRTLATKFMKQTRSNNLLRTQS